MMRSAARVRDDEPLFVRRGRGRIYASDHLAFAFSSAHRRRAGSDAQSALKHSEKERNMSGRRSYNACCIYSASCADLGHLAPNIPGNDDVAMNG